MCYTCVIHVVDAIPKSAVECLSYLPYLILLETLRRLPSSTKAGRSLRLQVTRVGVLQLVLQCLSLASHHSPRMEAERNVEASSDVIALEDQ